MEEKGRAQAKRTWKAFHGGSGCRNTYSYVTPHHSSQSRDPSRCIIVSPIDSVDVVPRSALYSAQNGILGDGLRTAEICIIHGFDDCKRLRGIKTVERYSSDLMEHSPVRHVRRADALAHAFSANGTRSISSNVSVLVEDSNRTIFCMAML